MQTYIVIVGSKYKIAGMSDSREEIQAKNKQEAIHNVKRKISIGLSNSEMRELTFRAEKV